jgi:hypothetical protein
MYSLEGWSRRGNLPARGTGWLKKLKRFLSCSGMSQISWLKAVVELNHEVSGTSEGTEACPHGSAESSCYRVPTCPTFLHVSQILTDFLIVSA